MLYTAPMVDEDVKIEAATASAKPALSRLPAGFTLDGRYQIESFLGEGGMCFVYKARHIDIERPAAVKILRPHLLADAAALQRFRREATAVSSLAHPHIVTAYGFGFIDERAPYIAMEFLDGISLSELLKREGRLPKERATNIFCQILDALEFAHKKGIIHRDLKPSNVMLTGHNYDDVKLVDFGIAKALPESGPELQKLTQSGEAFGTVAYMSPEQCLAGPLDARSDIYSMGCLMFETLDGAPPFTADNSYAVVNKHLSEPPRESNLVSGEFGDVILSALAKDPCLRPQSARQFKEALLDPSCRSHPPSAGKTAKPTGSLKVLKQLLPALAIMAVVLATGYSWLSSQSSDKNQEIDNKKAIASNGRIPLKYRPDVEGYLQVAVLCDNRKEFTRAEQIYSKCIDLDPDCYDAYLGRARVERDTGNYDRMISDAGKYSQIDGFYDEPHMLMAQGYGRSVAPIYHHGRMPKTEQTRRFEQALIEYQKAIDCNLREQKLMKSDRSYEKRLDRGRSNFSSTLSDVRLAENNDYLGMAECLFGLGKDAEALKYAEKALSAYPFREQAVTEVRLIRSALAKNKQ